MVEAARKYKRVVQVGMQTRSAAYIKSAKAYIQSGKMGKVYLVKVFNMMKHPFQRKTPDQPVPEGFNYDLWCGPAPKLPYNPSRRWLNMWEYSCGPIAGDAVHQIDIARYLIDDPPYPSAVSQTGRIDALSDGRNTPDTQLAMYDYDKLTFYFEAALWTPYIKKIPGTVRDTDKFPDWPFCSTRVEVLGTEGFMYFARHGGGWQAYDAKGELVRSEYGRRGDIPHQTNFIECIRSRKRPNADVEIGHHSVMLSHLANISFRTGNQRLIFDGKSEKITNLPQANQFLKRTYREHWAVPENV
jgi:predicted dehydrogenase